MWQTFETKLDKFWKTQVFCHNFLIRTKKWFINIWTAQLQLLRTEKKTRKVFLIFFKITRTNQGSISTLSLAIYDHHAPTRVYHLRYILCCALMSWLYFKYKRTILWNAEFPGNYKCIFYAFLLIVIIYHIIITNVEFRIYEMYLQLSNQGIRYFETTDILTKSIFLGRKIFCAKALLIIFIYWACLPFPHYIMFIR